MNSKRATGVVLAATLLLPALNVWGQGVSFNSPRNTVHTLIPGEIIPTVVGAESWWTKIGSEQAPLGVELDPRGEVWHAEFERSGIWPIRWPEILGIDAYLRVQGELPWTGWNIEIATPEFRWYRPPFIGNQPGSVLAGLESTVDGPRSFARFDPLTSGTNVRVHMSIEYTGAEPFYGNLKVIQYPVPEPASGLVLMIFISFKSLHRRRSM